MNHRFACLVAGLALSASASDVTSATVYEPLGNVDILVNGTAQPRYWHGGRWYVEALKGREYAIRLRNPYGVRVAVALSVDGLNTIDARQTTAANARKWVLGPHETVTISGWQTSRSEARRFEFTTEARSYAYALGKADNLGVISAVFFKERVPDVPIADAHSTRRDAREASEPQRSSSAAGQDAAAAAPASKPAQEYAATGMGRRTDHSVTDVWLDLEKTPAHAVNIRYEYRSQLEALGIVPSRIDRDALGRRERAQGFEPGFSPEPPRR